MSLPPKHLRRGFTLTELLVVIAIIAILASLGTVAVMRALGTARATAIKTELDQIDAAMKRYKETYGSYPPCNLAFDETGLTPQQRAQRLGAIRQHLAMAFPRYTADETKLRTTLTNAGIDTATFRPDQALVFWLQGFSADPTSPILSVEGYPLDANGNPVGTTPQKRTNNFFAFDQTRLAGQVSGAVTNPAPSYFPVNARFTTSTSPTRTFPVWDAGAPPIVYFDSRFYEFRAPVVGGNPAESNQFNQSGAVVFADAGVAVPYWHDRNNNSSSNLIEDENSQEGWANADSFQLIAAGGDGKYGEVAPPAAPAARLYPTGINYDLATMTDDDNATNFSSAAKLGDDLP